MILISNQIIKVLFIYSAIHLTFVAGVPPRKAINLDEFCGNENMVYKTLLRSVDEELKGTKKFPCDTLQYLERYGLMDSQKQNWNASVNKIGDGAVFVVAANGPYFPYLRRILHSIKKAFGKEQKVIGYDLGGISENPTMMDELHQVCNLEWRLFDYSLLPSELHDVEIFSWKIIILAEVLSEFNTVFYGDTSLNFIQKEPLNKFLEYMEQGVISSFQMPSETSYSSKFATLKGFYRYIPDYTFSMFPSSSHTEEEASFIIAQRSEYTRRLLKWAVSCAVTKDCINIIPPSTINCAQWTYNPVILKTPVGYHKCHLYDQTTLNLLNGNLEHEILVKGWKTSQNSKFVSRYDKRHPRYGLQRYFYVDKCKTLERNADFIGTVKC
ncbi:hypothetical protein Ddc_12535 [Ditylenchus destructor]|nr:hypothetical protein Ddc_12535 [Ditylenchus destructor]